ncbi:MAG: hypothetical protein LBC18_03110 [Opitutaceae bacterium]|jgi:hypothetical protein|nr:hypothetical protein [Opitutaceae bacterium]
MNWLRKLAAAVNCLRGEVCQTIYFYETGIRITFFASRWEVYELSGPKHERQIESVFPCTGKGYAYYLRKANDGKPAKYLLFLFVPPRTDPPTSSYCIMEPELSGNLAADAPLIRKQLLVECAPDRHDADKSHYRIIAEIHYDKYTRPSRNTPLPPLSPASR